MNQLDFYRHETLHTAYLVQEMFNDHVAESFYTKTVKNPTLQQAIERAQLALGEVYQAINEDNELKSQP